MSGASQPTSGFDALLESQAYEETAAFDADQGDRILQSRRRDAQTIWTQRAVRLARRLARLEAEREELARRLAIAEADRARHLHALVEAEAEMERMRIERAGGGGA